MENQSESEFLDEMVLPPSSPDLSPSPHSPKLKRLKKTTHLSPASPKSNHDPYLQPDGLDPLFSDGVKRVLEFNAPQFDSADFSWDKDMEILGLPQQNVDPIHEDKNKKKNKRKRAAKPDSSKRKEDQERKAYLAQQVEFQRVMRERKSVGFKPVPMVQKPISSILEKIRQRKMEVSKKSMSYRSVEKSDVRHEDFSIDDKRVADTSQFEAPVTVTSENKPCSSNEQTPSTNILVKETEKTFRSPDNDTQETEKSFRAPVNDTEDLFSDFQASESLENLLNEDSGSPVKDVTPSVKPLNLILEADSVLPDDRSSDEEESDKENTEPPPKPSSKHDFSTRDPVKAFVDEEALEDDSDNDLCHSDEKDEENDADMEEQRDYIVTDFKVKPMDREMCGQHHQNWVQQQDEAGTEKLLQKLKYGPKQQVEDEDEDEDAGLEDKEDESDTDDDDDDTDLFLQRSTTVTTKMLRQMIPKMFTDEDDGYESYDDDVTERSLSRELLLHKVGVERKTELLTVAKDESSKEVFGRIRKLNHVSETKTKAKTPSFFGALLTKGSGIDTNKKSSFLRRSSSHSLPTSKTRKGVSTGRSYIFGRDDSRSSTSVTEDSSASSVSQVKKAVAAKFTGSQVKWSSQEQERKTRGENIHETSLFEILKQSSVQTRHAIQDNNMVDHEAVFASFKSVRKQFKVDGRL